MRWIYEKFNIYIYLIIPIFITSIYFLCFKDFQLSKIQNYNQYNFEFVLTMLGALLTILGLMFTLPENNYRRLMKKYKHDEIINNTIFSGIISSLVFIVLLIIEVLPSIQEFLFITVICEVLIASWWMYRTLKNITSSVS